MAEQNGRPIREILAGIPSRLGRMKRDIADIQSRLSHVAVAIAQRLLQVVELDGPMDRFDERLARIERRLDLIDA